MADLTIEEFRAPAPTLSAPMRGPGGCGRIAGPVTGPAKETYPRRAIGCRMGNSRHASQGRAGGRTVQRWDCPSTCGPRRDDRRMDAIAVATRALIEQRDRWLNPEGKTVVDLAARTLIALYNDRPSWLDLAHRLSQRIRAGGLNVERAGALDQGTLVSVVVS